MNTAAHSGSNSENRLKDVLTAVREFGREAALGKDSLPKLAFKVAEAAKDGTLNAGKDADGKDDVGRIYDEYVGAMSKKAVHDHTANGLKANVSKLRQIVLASVKPTCDFPATLGKVFEAHQAMQTAAKETGIKPKPCYAAYVDAARMQVEQDDDLTDEQIEGVIRKKDAEEPDAEKVLTAIGKKLENLISGEKGPKDQDEHVIQAHDLIRERLAALLTQREVDETTKKASALGLIPDPALAPAPAPVEQVAA